MKLFGKKLLDQVPSISLPEITLPEITREVEIAVYLVHNTNNPEDYFFLFDFEEFVEKSKSGVFVRPVIRIFAGRDDFGRARFARQFREVFAQEFDRMRAVLATKKKRFGWLSFGTAIDLLGGFVSSIVLSIALSAGNKILETVGFSALLKGKSDGAKLRDEIEKTKSQVERALERIEITIHRELYDHAYRDGLMGKISGLDREAWPLPHYVRVHLEHGESGSWW